VIVPYRRAVAAVMALGLASCATLPRPELPADVIATEANRIDAIRYDIRRPPAPALAALAGDYHVLVLSGGGPDGAFGVGLLTGLSQNATLPDFAVVTGVSTGALMAPFVFLGTADAMQHLKALYTDPRLAMLTRQRSVLRLIRHPGLISSRPLADIIDEEVTPALLAGIAERHRKGHRLYIATADLDAQRLTIWDMGALASRLTPASLAQFRQILLAAASIPVAMDPVLIKVDPAGREPADSHADATIFSPFLFLPEMLPATDCGTLRQCSVSVVVHNKLVAEPRVIAWRPADIASRALETMVKSAIASQLQIARQIAAARGARFQMSFIDVPFPGISATTFDPQYMERVYEIGLARALAGQAWQGSGKSDR
jgi:predicted acylesterase/phospholipase RssA